MRLTHDFKSDFWIAAGLVLLTFLIRIPFLSHPPEPVFDEVHYSNFAIRTLNGEKNIDLHPPFLRILFAKILYLSGTANFLNTARFLTIIFGSLLAGIIFLISKKIYPANFLAILPPFLYIFDGSLITYSRLMLPEIYILFFGFTGFLCLFIAMDFDKNFYKYLLIFLSAIFFGISASIKWSGLGFLAAGLFLLFYKKKLKFILPLIAITLGVYFVIFSLIFPPNQFFKTNIAMFRAHSIIPTHPAQSRPYFWPFGEKTFTLWGNGKDAIKLIPNYAGWIGAFISVLLAIIYFLRSPRENHFLLFSFLVNYIPFFAISRPLFVYHYFGALVFGYLIVPKALKFINDTLFPQKDISKYYITLVVLFFLIFLPLIY